MVAAKGDTTVKVSRRIVRFVQSKAWDGESMDSTLKRLLGLGTNGEGPPKKPTGATIIKISRPVMEKILKEAKEDESRDETLARLLGLPKKQT
jgi:hypothetical protein